MAIPNCTRLLSHLRAHGGYFYYWTRCPACGFAHAVHLPLYGAMRPMQGALTAHIDRLPEDAKRTLQIAAGTGRTVNVNVLDRVLEMQANQ